MNHVPTPPAVSSKLRTGIFGGSFNPIHHGHVALARHILQQASLDEIWFMVSPLNPFKAASTDLLADDLRLKLTRHALEGEPGLVASDYEFHLPKPSYTWNTLRSLSADYTDRSFVLIIGADNWLAFDKWAEPQYILDHYDIVVYPRQGFPIDEATLPQGVRLVNTPLYNISSTDIRHRISMGQSISKLVPESIIELVQQYYR